jgi:hypothetical protein
MSLQGQGKIFTVLPLLVLSVLLAASPAPGAGEAVVRVPLPRPSGIDPPALPGEATGGGKSVPASVSGETLRNPFAVTEKLSRLAAQPSGKDSPASSGPAFIPQNQSLKLPKMRLRGRLKDESGDSVALLEIEGGGVYIVREGDDVGLHEFGNDSVLRIRKIDRLHVVVEAGTLKQLVIVR